MKNNDPLKKTLEKIDTTQKYDELDQYKHPSQWEELADEDVFLLANLFIRKGSLDLTKGDDVAEESFNIAIKLTRHNNDTYLKISRAFAVVENWDKALYYAHKTVENHQDFLEGWLEYAALKVLKGKSLQLDELFDEALHVFEKIAKDPVGLPPEVFFKWGQAYHCLGRLSQEPCDITRACEKYRQSEDLGYSDKHLFFDHALALAELATLVARADFIHESVLYLLRAVEIDQHFQEGWIYLAVTYQFLYEKGDSSDYYDRAESAFYTASRLNARNKTIWLSWGQMLLNEGRIKRNPEVVSLAIEKFERAKGFFPRDRDVHCFLADALMVLGLFEDRYELLKEAKDKIEECLRDKPDDAPVLFLYGTCLVHLGKYFSDENLIRQSFDKFERSIQLNAEDPHVWHSLGLAHFTYGDMTSDPIMLEKAVQIFESAQKLMNKADSELFNNWGVALMKLSEVTGDLLHVQVAADKFEQAIAFHETTKKGHEPDPEWYYNYGCALDYLGDFYQDPAFYEKAALVLGHVVTSFPTYNQARYNLALALTHYGDSLGDMETLEQGLHHFEILSQEDPEDEVVLADMGVALIALGELSLNAQAFAQSKRYYELAESKLLHSQALGSKTVFYWLACLYSLNSNIDESLHFLEKARDQDSLPVLEELHEEKWLDSLRSSEHWSHFINSIPKEEESQ